MRRRGCSPRRHRPRRTGRRGPVRRRERFGRDPGRRERRVDARRIAADHDHGARPAARAEGRGRGDPDDAAAVHDDDAIGDALHLVEVVGAQEDRAVPRPERDDELAEGLRHLGVERRRGLVEQEHRRVVHGRAGDRGLLLHAAGERAETLFEDGRQPEERAEVGDACLRARDIVEAAEEAEVGAEGQPLVERGCVGDHPAPRTHPVRVRAHREAVHGHVPRARREDAGDDAAHRGLARAVRAEQRDDLARRDREAGVRDGGEPPRPARDVRRRSYAQPTALWR